MKRACAVGIPDSDEQLQLLLKTSSLSKDLSLYVERITPTNLKTDLTDFIDLIATSPKSENLLLINRIVEFLKLPVVVIIFREKENLPENLYPYVEKKGVPVLVTYGKELFVKTGIKLITAVSNKIKLEVRPRELLQLRVSPNSSCLEKFKEKELHFRSSLSFKEALMLKLLFERPGETVPYEKFLELGIKEDSLPVYISKLRRMVKHLEPSLIIKSNRQNGYTLTQGL